MANKRISDVSSIEIKFRPENVNAKVEEITESLKNEFVNLKNKEAGVGNGKMFLWIVVKLVLLYIIYYAYNNVDIYVTAEALQNGVKIFGVLAMIYDIYSIVYALICFSAGKNQKKIEDVKNAFNKGLTNFDKKNYRGKILGAISKNEDYNIQAGNNVGKKIIKIRDGIVSCEKKLGLIHKYTSYVAGPLTLIVAIIYYFKNISGTVAEYFDYNTALAISIFGILLVLGTKCTLLAFYEKLGKSSKIISIVIACVFCLIVWKHVNAITMYSELVPQLKYSWVVFILIALGYLLMMALSDYAHEYECICNTEAAGFGYDNRSDLMIRVCCSVVSALVTYYVLLMAIQYNYSGNENVINAFIAVGVFAFLSNSILKSSTLKDTWGRKVSIPQALAFLGTLIMILASYQDIEIMERIIFVVFGWLAAALVFLIISRVRVSRG